MITFTCKKFAAMAHFDHLTNIEHLSMIFARFQKHSINLKDLKVVVIGGWREYGTKVGDMILEKIKQFKIVDVSTKHMYKKTPPPSGDYTKEESEDHFYLGLLVNANNGKTYVLHKIVDSKDPVQESRIEGFVSRYKELLCTELLNRRMDDLKIYAPLTEVTD